MWPHIIKKFNVFVNISLQLFNRIVIVVRKFFLLHAGKEGFCNGIVKWRSRIGERLLYFQLP